MNFLLWYFFCTLPLQVTCLPHVIYFLVDDLGYANVGYHNFEPLTPTIDSMCSSGTILNRFYTYKFCSPSRSSFLSGRLPMHVNQQNHPPNMPGGGVPPNMTVIARLLKKANYNTHIVGKWHGGMSRRQQIPINRGFDSSFGYLAGAEDHYTQVREKFVDFWRNDKPAWGENGTYGTFQYNNEAMRIIANHNTSKPMFMYLAYQNVHGPLQVPEQYLALYPNISYAPRRECLAMISIVDESIKNITMLLKEKKMWNNTLIIFSSDNGGPHDHGNNFPLRGSKGCDFDGGTRVAACLSGGFLPQKMRGKSVDGYMHICDWYSTLASIAGIDPTDEKAAKAGLPPIDSLDMWPMLSGVNSTSPRTEIPLSGGPLKGSGLILGRYKLIRGHQGTSMFPGIQMPNSSHDGRNSSIDCGKGCLFDIIADPVEHFDLASQKPDILDALIKRAQELDLTYYQSPGRDVKDPNASVAARTEYRGFWGPWQPDGPLPPTPSPPTPAPTPPPKKGFFLTFSNRCLRTHGLKKAALAQLGDCDGTSKWDIDSKGRLYNVAAPENTAFLRESPSQNCSLKNTIQLGITHNNIYTIFENGLLRLKACVAEDLCIGVPEYMDPNAFIGNFLSFTNIELQLVSCRSSTATGWTKQNTPP